MELADPSYSQCFSLCENMLSIFYKGVSCLSKSACSSRIVNTSAALYALPITETICQV